MMAVGPPVVEEVLVTPRGPVIGPALTPDMGAISMRAGWLDAKPARGFLRVHEARSFAEFRACFEHWPLLSQNVVYADSSGDIGWQLVGEAPRRRSPSAGKSARVHRPVVWPGKRDATATPEASLRVASAPSRQVSGFDGVSI